METATPPSAIERLRRAVKAPRSRAEVDEAVAIADLAAEHAWDEDATFDVVGTRPLRIGADGTALVEEFLPLEVATLKGISVGAATWLIRDVVNLKARHPLLWFQATKGLIPMFRASQLAAEAARFDLTAEQARAERFVRKLPTDDPTVAYLSARVDTADAIFFDAMVDRIADILGDRGDPALRRGRGRLLRNPRTHPAPSDAPRLLRGLPPQQPAGTRPGPRSHHPHQPGQPDQTRASNLGPLSRKAHRGKTHGGWHLDQPRPGTFWWRSPAGFQYRVGPGGTTRPFRNPGFHAFDQVQWDIDHHDHDPPP